MQLVTFILRSEDLIFNHVIGSHLRNCNCVLIEELNEYLLSMKFDSYYDDNLLQPEVGELRCSFLSHLSKAIASAMTRHTDPDIGPCKQLEQRSMGGWGPTSGCRRLSSK